MDDDCIQYLCTKPATRPLPSHPFLSNSQRPVTGIDLHVEKTATEAACNMTFYKAEEPVVHIGRRSASDSNKHKNEAGKSMLLSCPVVSRRHAKIAFSDSGHAYLIDLNSHHGTHVRKSGEALSKQLKAETPTLLADGDVLTFGKSVASDKGIVRPVVARVDLLYGTQPPLKPLVVPGVSEGKHKPLERPSSGRYGVYVPVSSAGSRSSSSDGLASPVPHDSDIEEIPGPSHAARAPRHEDGSDSASPIQVVNSSHYPVSLFCEGYQAFSPSPQEIIRPSSPFPDRDSLYNVGFDAYSHDIFEDEDDDSENSNYSRSTSPMDLSSSPEPSTPPAIIRVMSKENLLSAVGEPIIIGAWPGSRSSSPSVLSFSSPAVKDVPQSPVAESVASTPGLNDAHFPEVIDPEADASVVDDANAESGADKDTDIQVADNDNEIVRLKSSLVHIKTEVAKLHAHRRKYKQRFNDNIHVMGEKFSDLEERTTEIRDLYNRLSDNWTRAKVQIDALQEQMDATPEIAHKTVTEEPCYTDEAKANVKALEQLVAEMTVLRDNTRKEMADEVETARKAKETMLKLLAEQLEVQTASLKRKRSDDEDEGVSSTVVAVAEPPATLRPRKRAKRIAKVLAQTATAVTVGAVVTWSALAFS
ncbi:hypothetical protein B0H10DRAFT_2005130 [Mycena sp. CBHHK59/15]|nr:hypothetical protein B0H10DRAFT_2005130 [Mycena sp. CBHHK59/15]